MVQQIRTAIFPVAGLGTRFLPASKAIPKEMLVVVDKPLIQYAVEEAKAAGVERFVFVTARGKSAIEDHFDSDYELEALLMARGKTADLKRLKSLQLHPGQAAFVRQQSPLGLGHAVWCAREYVQNEPFAVILPDDFIASDVPCLKQMVDAYQEIGGNMVAVMDVSPDDVSSYGIIGGKEEGERCVRVDTVVEKPEQNRALSQTAIVGRYILQPQVFQYLDRQQQGRGGEIQLTDALASLLPQDRLYGFRFAGERFDCGTNEGWLAANLVSAYRRDDLKDHIEQMIQTYCITKKSIEENPCV